jgi:hypothetical protein
MVELVGQFAPVDPSRAMRLADAARELCEAVVSQAVRHERLDALVTELTAAGMWEPAEAAIAAMHAGDQKRQTTLRFVESLAASGRWDRAERLCATLTDPEARKQTLLVLVVALSRAVPAEPALRPTLARVSRLILASTDPFGCLEAISPLFVAEISDLCRAAVPAIMSVVSDQPSE